jgi:hypothetical protein
LEHRLRVPENGVLGRICGPETEEATIRKVIFKKKRNNVIILTSTRYTVIKLGGMG